MQQLVAEPRVDLCDELVEAALEAQVLRLVDHGDSTELQQRYGVSAPVGIAAAGRDRCQWPGHAEDPRQIVPVKVDAADQLASGPSPGQGGLGEQAAQEGEGVQEVLQAVSQLSPAPCGICLRARECRRAEAQQNVLAGCSVAGEVGVAGDLCEAPAEVTPQSIGGVRRHGPPRRGVHLRREASPHVGDDRGPQLAEGHISQHWVGGPRAADGLLQLVQQRQPCRRLAITDPAAQHGPGGVRGQRIPYESSVEQACIVGVHRLPPRVVVGLGGRG